ncbi:ATP-binding protein [Tindallia californiensis]|uniref:Histidine kinase-like ATPase domain-containing protein n=1 Tax=Tindallia californiensis TaxID=159292 RepID=A0A1H3I5D1_9FIRM|nr:ATP-binding protein [Tindallia californiensis]SDY22842.1 Histidine kinase-like ATPase domain-containing protein [Tindallia californiensis]
MKEFRVEFYSDFCEVDKHSILVTDFVVDHNGNLSSEERFNINFALRELMNNAVEHGNLSDPQKKIICTATSEEECITLIVQDEGDGFDLFQKNFDDTKRDDLENRRRGIWLLEKLGFDVVVEKNKVIAQYKREGKK